MQKDQTVSDMAVDVLARQAGTRATRTGETFEETLKAVLETEAGRQLGQLRDGSHRAESAQRWQRGLRRKRVQERAEEHNRAQQEARRIVQQEKQYRAKLAAWKKPSQQLCNV